MAAQIDIAGPPGSGAFGIGVTVLPNGNIVVVDPIGPVSNAGAVYLYDPAGALISTLIGSTAYDSIGSAGITVLANGHFVIRSSNWDNGAVADAGAVTWVDGSTGLSGVVSPSNSLVGSTAGDLVGSGGVTALGNSNYVVCSTFWADGAAGAVGAVTWANGNTGLSGAVSSANSLVGTTFGDRVCDRGVTALANGNYVVSSRFWNNGAVVDAGAVTWADGSNGLSGAVSPANSLVGATATDRVGSSGFTALGNGNYVIRSPFWNDGAVAEVGAVTWANGSAGLSGAVSPTNSLIGTTANDQVGYSGVTALGNGNYVVSSPFWNNGALANVGAVTWANGSSGLSGAVSPANSLIGTTAGDGVGINGVTALSNDNYVVSSRLWDNGAVANVGAVTWANGSIGLRGTVAPTNSLVGTTDNDQVGTTVTVLGNGNYVVTSLFWDNDAVADVGAVTWANGSVGQSGAVSPTNSLFGTTNSNRIGNGGITALSNGNYVVSTPGWNNGEVANVGAVTWANGSTGLSGAVSPTNSLIGTTAGDQVGIGDQVGDGGVTALDNGNYVVNSHRWNNGEVANVGAVTWANGSTGLSGEVAPTNSLVGTTAYDHVGMHGVTALGNGNYVVNSAYWDNGAVANVGAVTLVLGESGTIGTIFASNSVLGTVANQGPTMVFDYDFAREQLVVGRPASNLISLFTMPPSLVFFNGFE